MSRFEFHIGDAVRSGMKDIAGEMNAFRPPFLVSRKTEYW